MSCKGKCHNERKGKKVFYNRGERRCSICEVNIKTEAVKCYCCRRALRTVPQAGKPRRDRIETKVRI